MKSVFTKAITALILTASISIPSWSTDGYFTDGFGTNSKGMAGATIAFSQDALAAAANPAGMVTVGNRLDLGLDLFSPTRGYSVTGTPSGAPGTFPLAPGSVKSDKPTFWIPDFGYNKMIDDRSSIGISMYGNGGMNTSYPASSGGGYGTFGAGATGVNLEQLFVSSTYARRVSPKLAFGISLIYALQTFEATGLANFGPMVSDGNADNLTDRGKDHSTGWGVRLGVQAEVNDKVTIGAAYQPKIRMDKFKGYSDLFAEQGGFDIPANGTIGVAYHPGNESVLTFDIKKIWYGGVGSVGNPFSNLWAGMGGQTSYLLGGDNGPGFGWSDMTIYKIGYQKKGAADWTWRGGISYGKQPIGSSEVLFNILAPGVQEWHYTVGGTKALARNRELTFAVVYSPTSSVKGANLMEAPGQQQIELEMHQFELQLGYSVKL